MAVIHIEPIPPRCGPGEVLKFVAGQAKLDGKYIGKIALIGRGASVEVPDAKAAALVAALDGATFQEKRVRVRFAGKADYVEGDHFAHLGRLLDLEAAAEEAEALRRASAGHDTGDGTTLTALVLREAEFGLGGRLLLTLGRGGRSDPLPPNRLGPGSPVVLAQTKVQRGVTIRGVVFDRDVTTIGIAVEPPDEDLPEEATWRLDLSPDEVSRLRQQDALRRASSATHGRLAELRDTLVLDRPPRFNPPPKEPVSPYPATFNPSQIEAVEFALSAQDVAIVHGPPGTGKTTTVVEIIRRAVARGDKVLACAPSNAAVDNLLEKLLDAGELPVRLGHPARVMPSLRDRALDLLVDKHPDAREARKAVRNASALFRAAEKWTRGKPEPGEKASMRQGARELLAEARKLETLAVERVIDEARIVCATLTGIDSEVLGQRRFDLAVLDEACQSTEPASWLPLIRADRIVLAGDHCQLPPTVISKEAAEAGLAVSLMERLVSRFGSDVTRRLSVQYRMHESIMTFSSVEFYDGELTAADSVASHLLQDLEGVAANEMTSSPVRFIDTAGAGYDEEQEPDTESRFNRSEAQLAARKVRALLEAGVQPEQIAVITPYRAQVRLLRELLPVPGLEVDSVDGFQGREKEAVVLSLVRSNPEGEIGFLADIRRTNVAMTRARRHLLVIGDSATLSNHPFYGRLLTYFESCGAYGSVWEEGE